MKQRHLTALILGILLLAMCSGCAFFSTPQERSGINPKPFNSQSNWETQPMGGRITF